MEDHMLPIRATLTLDLNSPEGRAAMEAVTNLHELSGFIFHMRYNFARTVARRIESGEGALEALSNHLNDVFETYEPPTLLE